MATRFSAVPGALLDRPGDGTYRRGDRFVGDAIREGNPPMLWTIVVILLVLWLLGVLAFKVTGAAIHLLLVVALVVGLVQLFRGRAV